MREQGIRNAAILSGVGSLDRYHFHVVKTTNMPPGNTFVRGEGPFDILTVTGLVVDGEVHAHITFSNTEIAMGGHLEEGCRVLTFAVIVIAEALDVDFTRLGQAGTALAWFEETLNSRVTSSTRSNLVARRCLRSRSKARSQAVRKSRSRLFAAR